MTWWLWLLLAFLVGAVLGGTFGYWLGYVLWGPEEGEDDPFASPDNWGRG